MQHQQCAEERGLLGVLCPGQKKLEGKTFYLDNVKKRSTALLLEAISLLGGRVESFLHKDVNFLVTGSQESLKDQRSPDTKAGARGTTEEARPVMTRESPLSGDKRRPGTPRPLACGSRGKALLEKAIRNNERLQQSCVLTNARSWGVKILHVDDVLLYLKQLTRESFSTRHKKAEKTCAKQQGCQFVKAAALRSPYLKIEDLSRKYKPLHLQSMTFPTLWYSGRFSPFESPPPPRFDKQTEQGENKPREKKKSSIQDKSETPLSCNPSPWRPRKKDLSYCECCRQPFTHLEEHLQSDQHRAFVLDLSNYSVVDQLVGEMFPGFDPDPCQQSEEILNQPPTPSPIQDVCDLEPLSDDETEHAVKALQRQDSSFSHIFSPNRGPTSSHPASASPEIPIPNPATPPANTGCEHPDSYPQASSPTMPVLDLEPQAQDSASQQPDTRHLLPCPDMSCPSLDPFSLPPVLSPQVPYLSYVMEPQCPYSDPPVLSPQWYPAEDTVEGHTCEMDTAESVSVINSTALLPCVALTNADRTEGLNQGSLPSSTNGLKSPALLSCRSRSLPRQSASTSNPKKRCRSASAEYSRNKKGRMTVECSYSWTEQEDTSAKPESDKTKHEGCLLVDNVMTLSCRDPSTCTVDTLGLKQTFTFCVPAGQNFTQTPGQMDILGHGGTSAANQLSLPLCSKAQTLDPPHQFFPPDTSHSTFPSQDSERSLSHSTSVCIESALIPDLAALSPSSSDSDWDCDLLSRLGPAPATPLTPAEQSCELDKELLHRPCTWMHDTSYESRLHTALQPATPTPSLCGEEMDPSVFSRTVVQIVEVQH